jgi:hypothetical protein
MWPNLDLGSSRGSSKSGIDGVCILRYGHSMHLSKLTIATGFFVLAVGCGGSAPNAKSADGDAGTGNAAAGGDAQVGKQSECTEVEKKLAQLDEAGKSAKGAAARQARVSALEKMSNEIKASPFKTPGLDKATAEFVTAADAFIVKMKELNAAFEETEKIDEVLKAWQTKVEKVAEEFDVACNKAPKAECEAMSGRISKIPHLEGDGFAEYATELDKFVKTTTEHEVADPGLRTALKNMLSVLGEGVKPMARLGELINEPKKLDPAAKELKSKLNQVREMCGLPVRK